MKHRIATAVIVLALALTLVGCMGGKVKYPAYYTLHVPPAPDPPPSGSVVPRLAVREFTSPGYLRQGAIVYRVSPEQIGFYDYHRWAVEPRSFVTNAVVDGLRASDSFSSVKVYDGRSDIDFVLSGRLEKLEELDYDGKVRVEVAISAQLTNIKTGATVWSDTVGEVEQVEKHDVAGVVAKMNQAMERSIEKLVAAARIPQTVQ